MSGSQSSQPQTQGTPTNVGYASPNVNFGQTRQPLLYCGKRLLSEQYLPITDAALARLYDHNKYPTIPYTEEIAKVISDLEESLNDANEYSRRESRPGTPTPQGRERAITAFTPSRKRKAAVFSTYDQIIEALEDRGININDYVVPNVPTLSQEHSDHVKVYCKNRMMVAFVWTNAFKDCLVRDALGIDKDHLAFQAAVDICTDTRSSLQAKILSKGHTFSVLYNSSSDGLKNYTLKHIGKQPYYEDAAGKQGAARLPDPHDFPAYFREMSTIMDVFADVAEAVDWDYCFKKRNRELGFNHLGRAASVRTATIIQAECLNAIQNNWTTRQGVYCRPTNPTNQKKESFKRHHAVISTIRACDTTASPIIADPVALKRRADLLAAGHPVHGTDVPKVCCLYPLPRYLQLGRTRRRNVTKQAPVVNTANFLLFGDATLSELEDNDEEDEDEVDEEFQ
ncbi:hypothetical protein BJ508DRAFT_316164 [Ascobolus immersus RN42]|uniref:Uncharacterized protein n=1 Tax=Ascobolus immersus RN42 TaxID=1160509 RepID=A0A3N4HBP0_ASCIM|nr:hypothetical protein BJ508DRAFT_316164 [Ascobolus immersus RN42]